MFDFGLGFWILFFVIFLGCGRMCGWGARRYRERRRELDRDPPEADRLANLESRVRRLAKRGHERERVMRRASLQHGESDPPEPVRAHLSQKTPLEQLQQDFIDGRMTLTEYERELDRLERIE